MSALSNWIAEVGGDGSLAWLLLITKVTVLLGVAWTAHAALVSANPRWRVLLWRTTALGIVVLFGMAASPPLVSWAVVPAKYFRATQEGTLTNVSVGVVGGERSLNAAAVPRVPSPRPTSVVRSVEPNVKPNAGTASSTGMPSFAQTTDDNRNRNDANPSAASPSVLTKPDRETSLAKWWFAGVVLVWLVGVLLVAGRIAVGFWQIRVIRRRSEVAPDWIIAEAEQIAARIRCARAFSVRQSGDVMSPCLIGMWTSVVLLPSDACMRGGKEDIPAILAHELSHLKTWDLQWNAMFQGLSAILWFHPLIWRVRLIHADACDAVCDAVAAGYVGDAASYGRTLARLALRVLSPATAPGLAMARTSKVHQRIALLRRHVMLTHLPRLRAGCLVVAGIFSLALVGGFSLSQSQAESPAVQEAQQKSKDTDSKGATDKPPVAKATESKDTPAGNANKTGGSMSIQATAVGKPLSQVEIRYYGYVGKQRWRGSVETDESGHAVIEWKGDGALRNVWFTASKQGFVPLNYQWQDEQESVQLPEQLDLKFQPGILIGGVVNDEAGQPIKGAQVELTMPVSWPRLQSHAFTAGELTTDEKGAWRWPNAPEDTSSVSISVTHPDYIRGGASATKILENVIVLTQGLRVPGRVVDLDGRPVPGAVARLGFDRFGTNEPESRTDPEGRFVLKNCTEGKSLVTVQAEGFSPQFQEIVVRKDQKELAFKLEPGHTLRVQVRDVAGKPVAGAILATDTWRGFRSLELRTNTNDDGIIEWHSAPPDAVLCDILKSGYMATRRVPLKASPELQAITLYPELVVRGNVRDADSGKPIDNFEIRQGLLLGNSEQVYWSSDDGPKYTGGVYSYKFDEPHRGLYLQAVAPGYLPANSRKFESTEGQVKFDFQLKAGDGPTGIVVSSDGKPARGAEVGLATEDEKAMLDNGRFDRRQNRATVVNTDDQGRFTFSPPDESKYLIVVLHESGFAQLTAEQLKESDRITLSPWGRIVGRAMLGGKPDVNREISFYPADLGGSHSYVFTYGFNTKTDKEGRFGFDRVMPGKGSVSRTVVTSFGTSTMHSPGWQVMVNVKANESSAVQLGGKGRPVAGQVKLDRQPDVTIDWKLNEPVAIEAWDHEQKQSAQPYFRCLANLDESGNFLIPDVPTGTYRLEVKVNNPPNPNACGAGTEIGKGMVEFAIPEIAGGYDDEPFSLGTVTAKLFDTLDPGELAPDFLAPQLRGGNLRLSEFDGKLVLLDFWATWCAPCLAEMTTLKEIHEGFGGDPRFVVVSLSCDAEAEPARAYVEKNKYGWRHGFVGTANAGVGSKYTVRAVPATFLIAPNGLVLAKNLRGDQLKKAVAAALENKELFRPGAAARPPRFPVTRFTPPADKPTHAEPPAVAVLDDADQSYEKDQPHHDGLRLLSSTGKELWASVGFNNCQTVGGVHGVVIDRRRQRIFVRENVSHKIVAFDVWGRTLWHVEQIDAVNCLVVDEKTGNLWCSGGDSLNRGETVVFDSTGAEVAAFPYCAVDMAYDPHGDAFWLVGYNIYKLDRSGKVLFHKPVEGWCCVSVSANPQDGSVWITERDHPDIPKSNNRLWLLNADGSQRRVIETDKLDPFVVECNPQTGEAWVGMYGQGIRRISPTGEFSEPIDVHVNNISINPAGDVWISTDEAVMRLDSAGKVTARIPFAAPSQQAWLSAF